METGTALKRYKIQIGYLFLLFFLFGVNAHGGPSKAIVSSAKKVTQSQKVTSDQVDEVIDNLGLGSKSSKSLRNKVERALKRGALENPLVLIRSYFDGFRKHLDDPVSSAIFFSALDPSNENQMRGLFDIFVSIMNREVDREYGTLVRFNPSGLTPVDDIHQSVEYPVNYFSYRESVGSMTSIWRMFIRRLPSQKEVDLEAAVLSLFKTKEDMYGPMKVSSEGKNVEISDIPTLRDSHGLTDKSDELIDESDKELFEMGTDDYFGLSDVESVNAIDEDLLFIQDVKPRVLFDLIVWKGSWESNRYRFFSRSDETRSAYVYDEEEIKRLTELYTNPHFTLKPNHYHWDEVVDPIIQDRSNLKNKRIILKAYEDLRWIEENNAGFANVDMMSTKILRDHIRDVFKARADNIVKRGDDDFIRALSEAARENKAFSQWFDEILSEGIQGL